MAKVIIKKDGSAMVIYTREELHDIIESTRRREQPEGVKIMEKTK